MNIKQARTILWHSKKNIGQLLTYLRQNKEDWPVRRREAKEHLGANWSQLQEIYKRFPELAPTRVRQMKLEL